MNLNEKDIKKLSRTDLLELLLEQAEENEKLRKELAKVQMQLAERKIVLDKCGSIAEASLQLSGIFATAQKAADEYLENVKQYSESREEVFARILAEANEAADRIIADAKRKSRQIEEEAKRNSDQTLRCAKKAADDYWNAVSEKYNRKGDAENG